MMMFTRKQGDSIIIGDLEKNGFCIKVHVGDISGSKNNRTVKLAFESEGHQNIMRQELYDRLKRMGTNQERDPNRSHQKLVESQAYEIEFVPDDVEVKYED